MSSLLLSTAYFPPVQYMAAVVRASQVIIEGHETYLKQSYRNRCEIAGPNGIQRLTVPVIKPYGHQTKTHEVLLDGRTKWKINHWRSISTAYNSSPFFAYYKDDILPVFLADIPDLLTFNTRLFEHIIKLLGIKIVISYTATFDKNPEITNLRHEFHPLNRNLNKLNHKPYFQVFKAKHGFIPNLSILDLLFNEGPLALIYLKSPENNLA